MAAGYQWFVAWRYLLADGRKVSKAVMAFVGACILAAAALIVIGSITGNEYLYLAAVGVGAVAEFMIVVGIKRYFFTFFTTVSMAGCMVGAQALVVVLSVMSGFETDLRGKILGMNSHIRVTKEKGEFAEYRDIEKKIAAVDNVVGTSPYVQSEVVIAANKNYANVIIKGIDPKTVSRVTDLAKNAEQPRALERLWPLADDGGILGPPKDAGVPDARVGPDSEDGGQDPPPDGVSVDPDDPVDFSGGKLDPPPKGVKVDSGDPEDFSGGDVSDAGVGADAETAPGPPPTEPPPGQKVGPPGPPPVIGRTDPKFDLPRYPRIPPDVARLDGVLVGKELRKHIHLYVGQEVQIVSPVGRITPEGAKPNVLAFRIGGTFFTGMYEYDLKFVYVDMHALQALLGIKDIANGIEIRINDPDGTGSVMKDIRQAIGPDYRIQDWKEINRNLFSALKLEKMVMFLVLAIIILVASFSIIGNLIMVVVEKARQIALLKTLGSSDAQVRRLFIIQGFFIGLVGTTTGVAHGLGTCLLGKKFGLPLNPDVYYIDKLPIHIDPSSIFAVFVAGILISVVATVYPAYVASRLRPVDGLRYE